jgi:competence protein ComEC
LMFTCIAFGEVLNKKSSIYNTLALSAFILLCINPFWLWDVGFQLSYSAVLSIIVFFRPIYNWFYIKNKIADWLWKLNALTLAAQVLTLPISIYHFHQFPVLFLLANLVAVPLSSAIVIGEIILIVSSIISPLAKVFGWILQKLIAAMNFYVERLDTVSFAVWNNLSISFVQAAFLLGFIACIGYWLMEKQPKVVRAALVCLLGFIVLRSVSFVQSYQCC